MVVISKHFIIFTLASSVCCVALCNDTTYFQQSVNYKIDVKLNDTTHTLSGNIAIEYKNNSPHVLDRIGIHLYPNAYSHQKTAFARQKIQNGNTDFYTASADEYGHIGGLRFTVNDQKADLMAVKNQPDMAWLILPHALLPGQSLTIKSPFTVKIPRQFSRLGHVGQSYQISQWYPKPAVYDRTGWHLMPYLDQGEFYSEFGNYEVSITLPSNYIVAATGLLLNEEERAFLMQKDTQTRFAIENEDWATTEAPPSSAHVKTLRYYAENVHDFSWFADKRFKVLYHPVSLPTGQRIETWAFFLHASLWKNTPKYMERALRFLSSEIAEYPYPQMTAVESELKAGSGMEYPMITVIGNMADEFSLDNVLAHEIFHNWFYGILGFDERNHPFLDEGLTSFYEKKYMKQYYRPSSELIPEKWRRWLNGYSESKLMYLALAGQYLDHFPDQNAEHLNFVDYVYAVYEKTAQQFEYLEKASGNIAFQQAMRSFYEKWKFKHPGPQDLQKEMEKHMRTNLNWLFEGFFKSNKKSDYKLCKVVKTVDGFDVHIKNTKQIAAPFPMGCYFQKKLVSSQWHEGFVGKKVIRLPGDSCDAFRIDPENNTFDLNPANNEFDTKAFFPTWNPIRLRLLPLIDDPNRTDLGLTPVAGWNLYNGFMMGAQLSSAWFPARSFSLSAVPMYAFKNNKLVGLFKVSYDLYMSQGRLHGITLGASGKRFAYKNSGSGAIQYNQLSPFVQLNFRRSSASRIRQNIRYRLHLIDNEMDDESNARILNAVHQLRFSTIKSNALGIQSLQIKFQFENQTTSRNIRQKYLRMDVEGYRSFRIDNRRYFDCRLFLSGFLYHSDRNLMSISSRSNPDFYRGSVGLAYQNFLDQNNEEMFLGRSATSGFWSQQVYPFEMGGFKLPLGFPQKDNLGNSNAFVGAVNLSSDLPLKYIGQYIRPYFDIGFFQQQRLSVSEKLMYSGGINLRIYKEFLNFYLPVFYSKNIASIYDGYGPGHTYWNEISFSLHVKLPDLKSLLDTLVVGY